MLHPSCRFEHFPSARKNSASLSSIATTSDYFSVHHGSLHTLSTFERKDEAQSAAFTLKYYCSSDLDCHPKHVGSAFLFP